MVAPRSAWLAGLSRVRHPAVRKAPRAWSAPAAAGGSGGGDDAQGGHISVEARINERIRAPEVRLVGPKGEQIGIVSVSEALKLAQEADLDLVEVAPTARPPVCKLMDYGKFKYESAVKARESRKNQTQTVVKEIKLRPKIDPHDYGTKKGHVERFLKAGDKVKVTIMFRGREQSTTRTGLPPAAASRRRRGRARLRGVAAQAGRAEHDHGDRPAQEEEREKAHTGQANNRSVPSPRTAAQPPSSSAPQRRRARRTSPPPTAPRSRVRPPSRQQHPGRRNPRRKRRGR